MANRIATHILKNSNIVNRPLPTALLGGEPIVNTADGIVYFSGVTSSTNNWVPAGTGGSANFFEVGSNLYDLQLRNRITKYENTTGSGLVGKFLSGTTNGFVLANISSIVGVDTFVTGFTYSNNVATIRQNQGQADLSILINTMTGLTVNGTLAATTGNITTINTGTLNATGGTITTLGSTTATLGTANITTANVNTLNATGITVTNNVTANTFIGNLTGLASLATSATTALNATNATNATSATTALNATNVGVTNNTTTNASYFVTFASATSGNLPLQVDSNTLTFNPSTNTLTVTNVAGLASLATSATTALNATNAINANIANNAPVSGTFAAGTITMTNLTGGTFNITGLSSTDTFVTGFTYANNVATIRRNQGQADLSILINTMTGLTVNGTLAATTGNITTANIATLNATGGTVTTLGSTTANLGTANVATLNATGGTVTTLGSTTANLGTANVATLNATGGTITTLGSSTLNLGKIATYNGLADVSGQFLSGTTTGFVLAPISSIVGIDTFVTGFTYSPTTNTITLAQNQGQPNRTVQINTVSGLTVSDLTANRLVYTTTSGKLITGTATFDGTNMALPTAGSLSVGTGGLTVGSGGSPGVAGTGDVVINGSLTVFGASVSAFTSQLYVEDNNITLNYNPTGNTTATSIGSGWNIQDGNGINGGAVNLDIRAMNTFTGITSTQIPSIAEYGGSTGYANRAWVTQLNDVVIRSTNVATPNGVRVLAEFDVLDGGTY
jgi:hypothetical protein